MLAGQLTHLGIETEVWNGCSKRISDGAAVSEEVSKKKVIHSLVLPFNYLLAEASSKANEDYIFLLLLSPSVSVLEYTKYLWSRASFVISSMTGICSTIRTCSAHMHFNP